MPLVTTFGSDEDGLDYPAGTLGALLYASPKRKPVPEKDWTCLLGAIAAGDQRALRALYDRAHRLVFTLVVRITDDRETAEEVTLDVFHDVWRRASAYDSVGGSVLGWIMNQARSRAIDRLRFEQRKKRVNPYPDEPVTTAVPRGPQEACGVAEQGRRLRAALQALTRDERQAIETAFFSEFTHMQVAARLNEPLGTVKTRIRSGLGKLRSAMDIPDAS